MSLHKLGFLASVVCILISQGCQNPTIEAQELPLSRFHLQEGDLLHYTQHGHGDWFKVISTIASIEGKDNLIAIEDIHDREIRFISLENGRISRLFTHREQEGFSLKDSLQWVPIPQVGEPDVHQTIRDSSGQFAIITNIRLSALKKGSFLVNGFRFTTTVVLTDYESLYYVHPIHPTVIRTVSEMEYIDSLGIHARIGGTARASDSLAYLIRFES
jgi:hypothetical protein